MNHDIARASLAVCGLVGVAILCLAILCLAILHLAILDRRQNSHPNLRQGQPPRAVRSAPRSGEKKAA